MITDQETAKYVVTYFSHLLTDQEKLAIKHTHSLIKNESAMPGNSNLDRIYRQKGWITSDKSILDLLANGYDQFELTVANRIIEQFPEKVVLNN